MSCGKLIGKEDDNVSIDLYESAFDKESRWSRSALFRIDEWSDCDLEESRRFSNTIMGPARMDIVDLDTNEDQGMMDSRSDISSSAGAGAGMRCGNRTHTQVPFDDACSLNSSVIDQMHPATSRRCTLLKTGNLLQNRFFILASLLCLICTAMIVGLSFGVTPDSDSGGDAKTEDVQEAVAVAASSASAQITQDHNGQRHLSKSERQPLDDYQQDIMSEMNPMDYSSPHLKPQTRISRQAQMRSSNSNNRSVSRRNLNETAQGNQTEAEQSTNTSRNSSTKERQLPPDAASKNPISLLNEMQLNPKFNITHCSLHRKRTTVQSFIGYVKLPTRNTTYGPAYGRNKKEAKRRVAEMACTALYNLNYTMSSTENSRSVAEDPHLPTHVAVCNSIPS